MRRTSVPSHVKRHARADGSEQIVALPDVAGKHACECGHPEMRSLPDGTFHCPACRSEVVPTESHPCAVVSHAEEGEQKRVAGIAG
jgi:hypothetical protein